ncbi:MAG: hypothetical protein AAGA83_26280, partial [Cyanobacteria bacterium P01_F01_bin.116]
VSIGILIIGLHLFLLAIGYRQSDSLTSRPLMALSMHERLLMLRIAATAVPLMKKEPMEGFSSVSASYPNPSLTVPLAKGNPWQNLLSLMAKAWTNLKP